MHRYFVKNTIRLVAIALLLVSFPSVQAKTPQCALVLSGGGARGLAQIGVLIALEEHHIKPDLIVATSMGALVGGLYAAGYSADSIASLARSVNWSSVFRNRTERKLLFVNQKTEPSNTLFELRFNNQFQPMLPNAFSYGQLFYTLLAPLLVQQQYQSGADFDRLPIRLRIIATNVLNGEKVVFSQGNICNAIRASCSVPLSFSPVEIDSMLLIDGGITANIPVETARQMHANHVIAINVTSPLWKREDLNNPVKFVDQIISISVSKRKSTEVNHADLVITPNLDGFKKTDFASIDSLIERGYAAMLPYCDSLSLLLNHPETSTITPVESSSDTIQIARRQLLTAPQQVHDTTSSTPSHILPRTNRIAIIGNKKTDGGFITLASGLNRDDSISAEVVKKAITALHVTNLFENVNIDLDATATTRIMVEEKPFWRLRMGLRYDTFHLGEGFLEPAYENLFGKGILALLHLQYGLRRERNTFELQGNYLFSPNIANNFIFQIYTSKEKTLESNPPVLDSVSSIESVSLQENTLRKTGMKFYIGTQLGHYTLISAGVRLERFKVQQSESDFLGDALGINYRKTLPFFSIHLIMDSMDKHPFPTNGTKMFFSFGGANRTFGGHYSFFKTTGSIGRYFSIFTNHMLYPELSFSWASSKLPEVERVYLGGALSEERYQDVSIYNYVPFSSLPPRTTIGDMFGICHLEYRLTLKKNLYLQLLLDWGTVWNIEDRDYQQIMAGAPVGFGTRIAYDAPFGPIRLAYGHVLKKSDQFSTNSTGIFYFSIGHDF